MSADDLIITDRLGERPSRAPDHAAESRALEALAEELAGRPENLLQKLAETLVELGVAHSAGISIEEIAEVRQFRWVALAGVWSHHRGGTIPFDASPCGIVVERDEMLLFESPERFFPAAKAEPLIHEGLLVPFHSGGRPVGTVWVNAHRPERRFDMEDARLLEALARFASAGYQMTRALRSAEAGRSQSETRLSALAHASSDVFYTMSADMRVLHELSGGNFIPDATSPSRDWLREYIPPEDHARTLAAIDEAIRTKGVFELEHRVRRVDGETGWALSRAVPILGADSEIVEWFGTASDITLRKQAEITLREEEERQTYLLKLSDALRPVADPVAIQEVAARALGQHLGATRVAYVEVVQDHYVIARDYTDGAPSMVGRYPVSEFGAGKVADYRSGETRVVRNTNLDVHNAPADNANFAAFHIRAGIGAPLIKGGDFTATLVVHMDAPRDWTPAEVALVEETAQRTWGAVERTRAEAALRESEARRSAAFATVPVGVAVIDMDGSVVTANEEYRRFLPNGVTPSHDPAGLGQWHAWDAEGRVLEPHAYPGARAMRGERVVPGQDMLYTTDEGCDVWTRVASVPILDEGGQVAAVASVVSDIDDAKRTADALRESEARYRSLFQSIDDGYALIEFLPEADDQSPDFRFVEVNGSFERQTGNHDVAGRLGSEINPGDDDVWIETFGEVARDRLPRRFEMRHRQTGRWYNAFATPVGDPGRRQVCVVFADTTERKERERRQAFQLTLSDTLRPLVDAGEIMEAASKALGQYLNVGRCAYCEVDETGDYFTVDRDWTDGVMHSYVGRHFFGFGDRFLEDYRAGRSVVIDDALADARAAGGEAAFEAAGGVRASIGIPLNKEGRFVAGFFVQQREPRRWTTQEEALTREVAERVWAAVERARVEASLAESEDKHRTLFETMGQGYGEVELVRDAHGRAIDHRYIELNRAFERLVGIPAAQAKGRLATEVIPGMESWWHETFDRIVRGGAPEQFEAAAGPLETWFSVFAYPRGGDRLVLLYEDVTDRKRAETVLRDSEERQTFLLKLSDTLRPLADPALIQRAACRILGEQLEVDRAYYGETDEAADIARVGANYLRGDQPSLEGIHRLSDFGWLRPILRSGGMVAVSDTENSPSVPTSDRAALAALGVRAIAVAPLVKDGALVGCLAITCGEPRHWKEPDLELLRETGERTWAALERALVEGALRATEERLLRFGEASQDILWIRDAATLQWTYLTPAFEAIYGLSREEALSGDDYRNWQDVIVPDDRAHAVASIERVLAGEQVTFEYRVRRPSDGAIRWLRNTDFPIFDDAGRVVSIGGVGHDMTDLKAVQAEIAGSEERLRTLMEGIPQLVWRAVDGGEWTWASPQWTAFTGQGQADSHGWGWLRTLHPDDRDVARDAWHHAIERGGIETEYRLCNAESGAHRWVQSRATPVRDEAGEIVEWLGTSTDIDDLRTLQGRQQVMVQELQHRTRNLITVVGALSAQTMKNASSLGDFEQQFGHRLSALSRVQGLLSHLSAGKRIAFDELLRSELNALGASADRFTLDGPPGVPLRSATVQTFSLALHELATNALKYGALATPGGHLRVRWSVSGTPDEEPRLQVDWRESGVALTQVVDRPSGGGYGRELIVRALPYQLGADTTYEITTDGVHCTIDVPIPRMQAVTDDRLEHSAA